MADPKINRRPKPIGDISRSTAAKTVTIRDAAPLQDKIRERAHQFYEGRGGHPGRDQEDWLRAEQEILGCR